MRPSARTAIPAAAAPPKRALCSSSGGKDSLLALWHARSADLLPTTLLTMFDETGLRSRSHGVPRALVEAQAAALGLDLVGPSAGWKDYEKVFVEALQRLRREGVEAAIFGDIDLEPHRAWEEKVCRQAGLDHCLPLWQRNRLELAQESISLGFKAIVVCVDSRFLSDEFCGRAFDQHFIDDLPAGVDACGENGEFHTFVHDGPMFQRPVNFVFTGRSEYVAPPEFGSQRYCFANLAVPPVDATHCPLCGKPNACGMEAGKSTCWCAGASFPKESIERVPAESRGVACICAACARQQALSERADPCAESPPAACPSN